MQARRKSRRKRRPVQALAVRQQPTINRTELPLAAIASGTTGTIQAMLLDRMSRAENAQRLIFEQMREAVDALVTAQLCNLVRDGVLIQQNVPKPRGKELGEQHRSFIRIRASEIAAQEDSELEPWYRPKPLSDAILQLVGLSYRRKVWPAYFNAYGCIACGTKELQHAAHGFCAGCCQQVHKRIRKMCTAPPPPPPRQTGNRRGRPRRAPYVLK